MEKRTNIFTGEICDKSEFVPKRIGRDHPDFDDGLTMLGIGDHYNALDVVALWALPDLWIAENLSGEFTTCVDQHEILSRDINEVVEWLWENALEAYGNE